MTDPIDAAIAATNGKRMVRMLRVAVALPSGAPCEIALPADYGPIEVAAIVGTLVDVRLQRDMPTSRILIPS